MPKMQEVFKIQGVPDLTFVEPADFELLKVALDTPGRGIVVEGPSGIGKSTAVDHAIQGVSPDFRVTKLSARDPQDVAYIQLLPEMKDFGTVVVDDFHRLPTDLRSALADTLKLTADREDQSSKLILVGINQAGRSLIEFAPDLLNRIEVLRFEVEPPDAVRRLIEQGEAALNIEIAAKPQLVEIAQGSFYLAQLLCHHMCVLSGVTATEEDRRSVPTAAATVTERVLDRAKDRFGPAVQTFARGTRFRPSGLAPYLHMLRWLAESDSWSISLTDEMARHPKQKASVSQVVNKGFLANLIAGLDEDQSLLHFDETTKILSVEDPQLVFYLRHIKWDAFAREVGFTNTDFSREYDVALSFAGEDRPFAKLLCDSLTDLGLVVFYDEAEQHRILATNIESFLGPIYRSEARFVVAVIGVEYGRKIWTKFESDQFKHRLDRNEVVPVWNVALPAAVLDPIRSYGSTTFNPDEELTVQARIVADLVSQMIDDRSAGGFASA